ARRRASSRSVLRFRCLNFQASLAVLATRHRTPNSTHKSRTQPAKRQASIRTTVGPCRSISPVSTARLVEPVTKRTSPAGRTTQATLLYLPRSMARMVSAAVALANVVIVQAPWGRWGVEVWQLSRYHDPTACMDSFGVRRQVASRSIRNLEANDA